MFVSNTNMKIVSNIDINRDKKKLSVVKPDVPKTVIPAVQHNPVGVTRPHNLRMLTEKHNDEKLAIAILIVGTGLIAYQLW